MQLKLTVVMRRLKILKGRNVKPVGKATNPSKTLKRLFSMVFKGKGFLLALVVIFALISTFSSVYIATILQELIDDYITPLIGNPNPEYTSLLLAMLKWGAIMALGAIATYLTGRIMVVISQNSLNKIRTSMFKKLETLPLKYFDQHPHGEVMSRFTNDTDTINQLVSQSLVSIFTSTLTVLAVFVAMLLNSWILTLVVVFSMAMMLFFVAFIGKKSRKNFVKQQKDLAKVNGYIEEMIYGSKVVKVFTHEEKNKEEFDVINDELKESMRRAHSYSNVMGPVMNNIGNIQYVLLVLVGAGIAIGGKVGYTIGALAAFLQLSRSFTNPLSQLAQQVSSVFMALAGAERVFDLIDETAEVDEGYVTLVNVKDLKNGECEECDEHTGQWAWKHPHIDGSKTTYTPVKGDIVLENVDFGYNDDKLVLKNISLYAKPGEKIAFVGSTGAGKTTITNLINRFYDIQDGKIRFDGINIKKIKKDDLRRSLGTVLQDTHLFTGTIKENIKFGKLDATDEEVIKAAKLANAHDFIMMMDKGYDTNLTNDGEELSQGQRQLLSIARAAVMNPPVLVLDEATSSIDTHTESLVQEGMDKLMDGRTTLVIAHRLSTVKNSKAIMVLENGEIIERGNHEDLIKQEGMYYKLYTGAFELT